VSRSGGFWVFGIFGGICHSCMYIVYSRRVLRSSVSQECIHYDGTRFKSYAEPQCEHRVYVQII